MPVNVLMIILATERLCSSITIFCTFLCHRCTTTSWKCLIDYVFWRTWTKESDFLFVFLNFRYSVYEFTFRKNYQHLTNWTRWNKCDQLTKDGRVFFLYNQYSVGRALIFRGWVGEGVSLREVLTPQHRTEIRINTAEENGKPDWNYTKMSKYRKPLCFVKRQYRNLNNNNFRKSHHRKPLHPPPGKVPDSRYNRMTPSSFLSCLFAGLNGEENASRASPIKGSTALFPADYIPVVSCYKIWDIRQNFWSVK